MERLQRDFEMGPMYQAHVVGRDLQLFVTPVNANATLVALVENPATPATISMHLLALARDAMPLLDQPEFDEPEPQELEPEASEPPEPEPPEPEHQEPEAEEPQPHEGDRVEAVAATHDS
jgi:hypothetical protein